MKLGNVNTQFLLGHNELTLQKRIIEHQTGDKFETNYNYINLIRCIEAEGQLDQHEYRSRDAKIAYQGRPNVNDWGFQLKLITTTRQTNQLINHLINQLINGAT